jgi:hypothetical protein
MEGFIKKLTALVVFLVLNESFPKIPDHGLIRDLFGKARKFQKRNTVIRPSFKLGI